MKLTQFWHIGLVALCIQVMTGCGHSGSKNKDTKKTVPTTILTLHNVNLPQTFVADIQAVQFVEVKPKVVGFIETIFVDEGQLVQKGDKLFQLSSSEYTEKVREAQAAQKQAEAEFQMAEYEKSRITRLVNKNIISSIRLHQANSEVEVAKLKVEQAGAKLQRAHVDLSYTLITAPYSGYIDRIPYKKGSLVNAESLLTSISDVSEVFAYFKMNETAYLTYKRALLNGKVTHQTDSIKLVLSDNSEYEYRGKIETTEGDFERGTGSIAFRARFPNPDGLLKHGVTGKISITTLMSDVYLVPQQSTFEIQEFTYVYVVDKKGNVKIRSFEPLGRYMGFYITHDFEPDTQIIYSGIQSIKDGMQVIPEAIAFDQIEKDMAVVNDSM